MKKPLFLLAAVALFSYQSLLAQGVAINATGAAADSSAMLDIASTRQGMLAPRMDSAQISAINSPATGLLVYQTDGATPGFYFYNGSAWSTVGGFPVGNTGDMMYNNGSAWVKLAAGTNGQYLTMSGGIPTWANAFATLTTDTVSDISNATATCGGDITGSGSSLITARGVCWSISPNPSAALATKTTDGSDTGSFTSSITGLAQGTMYYARAYATNSSGTAYGTEVTFTTKNILLAVGDTFGGGIVAYILQPGDPGYNSSAQHGLIAAPYDQGDNDAFWSHSYTYIGPSDTATAIGAGASNTAAIVSAIGAGTAAYMCDTLTLGGYTDWYLPSKNELNELYLNQDIIGGFDVYSYWVDYWSSSEYDANYAWLQNFSGGWVYNNIGKGNTYNVRAVRSF